VTFKDLGLVQQEIIESLENKTGNIDTTNLQITFALLIDAFRKDRSKFNRVNDGTPNIGAIVGEILQSANNQNLQGQSPRSIDKCIKDAIKAKKHLSGSMSNTKLRNFQITFGLLVEAFAKKDAVSKPDAAKIAEHLAEHANDLPEQDQNTIETRILEALEFRNHPNSMKD
jgi:hypothetical protein